MSNYYMEGYSLTPNPILDEQLQPSASGQLASSRSEESEFTSRVLGVSPMQLSLSETEQRNMMKSIEEIFQLEEVMADGGNGEEEIGEADEESTVDVEDQRMRTEKLAGTLSTLAQLWWAGSEHMDLATEKLADGSRDREFFTTEPPLSFAFVLCL
jgi:hypothetical protein